MSKIDEKIAKYLSGVNEAIWETDKDELEYRIASYEKTFKTKFPRLKNVNELLKLKDMPYGFVLEYKDNTLLFTSGSGSAETLTKYALGSDCWIMYSATEMKGPYSFPKIKVIFKVDGWTIKPVKIDVEIK